MTPAQSKAVRELLDALNGQDQLRELHRVSVFDGRDMQHDERQCWPVVKRIIQAVAEVEAVMEDK